MTTASSDGHPNYVHNFHSNPQDLHTVNLKQVANLQCAHINSVSYPQWDEECDTVG